MNEPPAEVISAALDWCRRQGYEASGIQYRAVFVKKDDDLNPPDEHRDLWHLFFHPESLKHFHRDFFVVVVDPVTMEAEGR